MPRPYIPDSIKAQKGTLQACRTNPAQPRPPSSEIPDPPARFATDEAQAWRDLSAKVAPLRVYTAADELAFEQAALMLAHSRRTFADPDASPNERVNSTKAVGYWLAHFGLSPSTRVKVSAAPKNEKTDPLAEFLS